MCLADSQVSARYTGHPRRCTTSRIHRAGITCGRYCCPSTTSSSSFRCSSMAPRSRYFKPRALRLAWATRHRSTTIQSPYDPARISTSPARSLAQIVATIYRSHAPARDERRQRSTYPGIYLSLAPAAAGNNIAHSLTWRWRGCRQGERPPGTTWVPRLCR